MKTKLQKWKEKQMYRYSKQQTGEIAYKPGHDFEGETLREKLNP